MLENYVKVALRTFYRNKVFSLINVLGLSIGLGCGLLILLWVQYQYSYDQFHENKGRLYRVLENQTYSDGHVLTTPSTPGLLASSLEEEIAGIEKGIRVSWNQQMVFLHEKAFFRESGVYADPALFQAFSFTLIQGDPATALTNISSVVISEKMAEKYFKNTDPIGKVFRVEGRYDMQVTGVFQDIPETSSLTFDYVIPFERYLNDNLWLYEWGNNAVRTFVLLDEEADIEKVNVQIEGFIQSKFEESVVHLFLQPFTDAHLYSRFDGGKLVGGRIETVRMFAIIAFFIIFIACINFMNLATAQSSKRAREVGVRKVIGAYNSMIRIQFLAESFFLVVLSMALSLIFVEAILPLFATLVGQPVQIHYQSPMFWICFCGIGLFTALFAGSYPAFFLSRFEPTTVLKGKNTTQSRQTVFFRKGLVVFQFVLSLVLIIGTLVVYQQIQYIRSKDLGLQKENLVFFPLSSGIAQHFEAFKADLVQHDAIRAVSASTQNPIDVGNNTSDPDWDGKLPSDNILFSVIEAKHDIVSTLGLNIVKGRDFSVDIPSDTAAWIVNEEAVARMRMDDPIGQRLEFWGVKGTIIGVVKNFHSNSLHMNYEPLIIGLNHERPWLVMVKIASGQTETALDRLTVTAKKYDPTSPLDFRFLDQAFESLYKADILIGTLARYFSFIALFVSCLGLLGLSAYAAEQRTKEIGIRKVMGASVTDVLFLLTREFTKLVLIAFLLGAPLAWWISEQYLQKFAFRISIGWQVFLVAGATALLFSWFVVSFQSWKAALSNPANSLKME